MNVMFSKLSDAFQNDLLSSIKGQSHYYRKSLKMTCRLLESSRFTFIKYLSHQTETSQCIKNVVK